MSLDALHTPSSAASQAPRPPPSAGGDGTRTVQSELKRLTDVRAGIQEQLDVYFSVLSSNNCTMDTPLVDREGFPRSDIDVASVRTARMWITRLRNDLKGVMSELATVVEKGLPKGEEIEEEGDDVKMEEEVAEGEKAWARVDAVAPGSPADSAGLKRDDLLLSLSSVTASNHDNLRAVAALVARSEGVELEVLVKREEEKIELKLTPSKWSGRGLLGCHIVPYSASS
ncbi:hypothetical protein JCM11251_007745 [Rhodosporidiobolus azoricus]